ncbi:MAG: hypothetical protein PHD37_10250 [Gallionellaceae bacterium]|nr:hypothetical protein [Gallionellaceae bacterium]
MSRLMILPAFGVWPMLEFELDIVERRLAEGHEVVWLMCEGNAPFCPANLALKKRVCMECRSRTRAGLNWLSHHKNLKVGSLYALEPAQCSESEDWAGRAVLGPKPTAPGLPADLAATDWYESAFSTLQTTYKEFRPDLAMREPMLRQMILDFFQSHLAFRNNLARHAPDEVWLFNGRITRFRPALRVCQRESRRVYAYEYPYHGFKRYVVFEGQYPHDFGFRSRAWKQRFDSYPLPLEKKLAIGDTWYQRRLSRIQIGYEKVFSVWQTEGLLPPDWNRERYNVAVFNSSEWESAGVPESRRWNYEDQYSALERILQDTQHLPHLHFTFRIHPHMAKKDTESAERFLTLARFPNVTVLPPESKYDTYALVMASNVVLTFYSLVGVETAWLGRQAICLGPTPYQDFGCVYLPRTHEELLDTLSHPEQMADRFPSIEARKRGAQEFAFARIFAGTKPRYVVKRHYTRALMRRDGVATEIKAGFAIRALNRVLSLPAYTVEAVQRIRKDEFLRKEIAQSPGRAVLRFIRERLMGTVP